MKNVRQFTRFQADDQVHDLLRQVLANAGELGRHCADAPKARSLLQQLYETANALNEWYELDGVLQIVVSFQPVLPGGDSDNNVGDVPF